MDQVSVSARGFCVGCCLAPGGGPDAQTQLPPSQRTKRVVVRAKSLDKEH